MKVRLYVEGGPRGAHADGLRRFKTAFKQHLLRLDPALRSMEVSPCGSTEDTMRDYARALKESRPEWRVALLVDSDGPVRTPNPAIHLESKLNSANVPKDARKNVFLMVQCMEAWLVTDHKAVEVCFGRQVRSGELPLNPNVEAVLKKDLFSALNKLAKHTPTGKYHKVRDAAGILSELNPTLVAARSSCAKDLHEFLIDSLNASALQG